MFTSQDRENLIQKIVDQLKNDKNINAILLVGSLGSGQFDEYSDIDMTIVVKDGYVEKSWKSFEKHIKKLDYFKYFKQIYNPNSLLYGIFTCNGLEIDLGFNDYENFNQNFTKRKNVKIKKLYIAKDFKLDLVSTRKSNNSNVNDIVQERIDDIWYYFKNSIFALKRKRIFRALNEVDKLKNKIIEIYAVKYDLEFKHYKNLDLLPTSVKNLIIKDIPTSIDYDGLKASIVNLLNHFCRIFKENNHEEDAKNYKKIFTKLMKDVNL